MKKWILRAGIVLWLMCSLVMLTLTHEETDLPKLYKQTSPAVVWIGAENDWPGGTKWQGTGFFVTPDLIATAGHVVQDTKSFEVMFSDGTRAKADFVHMESLDRCDVGFIKLRSEHRKKRPCFNFDTEVRIGEDLIILGYPWGLNNGITLTQGVVSLVGRDESYFGTKLVIHTDTASWPGNSGSPVVDMDGECVGILIGGAYGCDNFSIVTPARLVELAMQKALAEIGLRDAR
ncbi:trypsin-like peptidase domain-containing protein [Candidatus Pacearchaeota archaeon]|nr:trypsin-like peptidase domain-containing protein [Candidatus Pacearchaeota archaeon]